MMSKKAYFINATEKIHQKNGAQNVTLVYNSKTLLNQLKYNGQESEYRKKFYRYLTNNNNLKFHINIYCLHLTPNKEKWLGLKYSDVHKHFGVSKNNLPCEFVNALQNVDNLADIQYRGKSIL